MGKPVKPTAGGQKSAPSMSIQLKKAREQAMRAGQIPNDLGLLPDTFIQPRGKNLPSWFTNFNGRWVMEKRKLKLRSVEFFSAVMYRYFMVRPRPRLELGKIPGIAKDLHREMYERFAAGDLTPMEGRICDGMLGSLKRRMAQRAPNTRLLWTVHRYLSSPKRMSYKAAAMPRQKGATLADASGLVQAVVRIHSLQSLQHVKKISERGERGKMTVREVVVDAQGRETPLDEFVKKQAEVGVPEGAKETIEYLVVQKNLRKGKEGPWIVWGTVEETTLDKVKKQGRKSLMQLYQNEV
ncbi:hypothetical protein LTR78_005859 [Recurvomyces mirabilis]|uniref:Tim44-like domain-containing protein n=1 Tax=Recurvomyces mirabilis TaxID=574656 RepID=A0AAE0WMD2_9PEZI|nr:hypothetical protein LTR78_005859 [Recurvomyces mirabilis]KAK5154240.1 hypothetical protein LTS14_006925 [Recurvomyces mirabilis]